MNPSKIQARFLQSSPELSLIFFLVSLKERCAVAFPFYASLRITNPFSDHLRSGKDTALQSPFN